jgi:hypothetical protein
MSIDDIEAEALKLAPAARARLAERLLESLETLSDEENARLWAEEAQRRDEAWEADGTSGHAAADVFSRGTSPAEMNARRLPRVGPRSS